jgi:hypothetical protein
MPQVLSVVPCELKVLAAPTPLFLQILGLVYAGIAQPPATVTIHDDFHGTCRTVRFGSDVHGISVLDVHFVFLS